MAYLLSQLSDTLPVILTRTQTVCSCGLFTSSFVGSLYIFHHSRVSAAKGKTRDHPSVIKARLYSVGLSTCFSFCTLWSIIKYKGLFNGLSLSEQVNIFAQLLGLTLSTSPIKLLVYPALVTATLFLGPLYSLWLESSLPFQSRFDFELDVKQRLTSLTGIRNYIIGPLTEELVFRSCVAAASVLGGESPSQIVFLSPLYFGIAHIHHAWEVYLNGGKTKQALKSGILQSLFQFGYTTLFGWYATFLHIRTGSVIAPFLSHVFCNFMGFPNIGETLQDYPDRKHLIYLTYVTGIVGFGTMLKSWTDPTLYVDGANLLWRSITN